MEDRETAINAFRALVDGEEDLYVGTDDKSLLTYLHWTNFNIDESFEKMKYMFKMKAEYSQWYAHRRDPDLHDSILKKGIHQLFDNRDQLGRRIYLYKCANLVYGEYEPHEIFQVDDLWGRLVFDEEDTQKNGIVVMIDMDQLSWRFLRHFTPNNIWVATKKIEYFPVLHKQFHVINAGMILNTLISLVFPFLSDEIKKTIFFHNSYQSLHAYISPSALPIEYEGELPSKDPAALVRDYLDTRNERMSELLSYGYKKKTKP